MRCFNVISVDDAREHRFCCVLDGRDCLRIAQNTRGNHASLLVAKGGESLIIVIVACGKNDPNLGSDSSC